MDSQNRAVHTPDTPWWKRGVIYQIAVSSFADSNGDGRGDLRGIIDRLDYLNDGTDASLGVDAIWLTPVNTSPLSDFGYDVSDYRSIDPRFGSMQDFDDLVAECHRRGIRVVMDLVLNHTSIEHPWFVESRSSRENPRRDWYIWRDGRAPGKPPNSWVAVAEGSAWQFDDATGQYYYHAFLPFQPDLNWRNPEVREEMFGVARFWLARVVYGFRLDLVNCLYEDAELRDNPPKLGPRPYLAQKHLHDLSQPESLVVASELRSLVEDYGGRMLMGEVLTETPDVCIDYLGDGTDRLHLSFYLDFIRNKWRANAFSGSVRWLEEHVPPGAWPCYYLDNHDLPRSYTRLGGGQPMARARVAAACDAADPARHADPVLRPGDRHAVQQDPAWHAGRPHRAEVLATARRAGRIPHAHAVERGHVRGLQRLEVMAAGGFVLPHAQRRRREPPAGFAPQLVSAPASAAARQRGAQ